MSAVRSQPGQAAPDVAERAMHLGDIADVLALECSVYPFPWTHGNFVDSLVAGHRATVLRPAGGGALIGYCVAMPGVEETHLLNLTVAPAHWGRGWARRMLDTLIEHGRAEHRSRLWLEVRESNQRARAIYERYGFVPVGCRRAYYPALRGREDAIVMRLDLAAAPGAAT